MYTQAKSSYKGSFKPYNPNKYHGTLPIIYRSSWEYGFMRWCDSNKKVINWSSESTIIPYYFHLDGKYHRYYIDFTVLFETEGTYLIEVKPKKRTIQPKANKSGRITGRFIREAVEYEKNKCKWDFAHKYAKERGYTFVVWTEDDLKQLGIPII